MVQQLFGKFKQEAGEQQAEFSLVTFLIFDSFWLQIKRFRKPAGVIMNANKSICFQIIDFLP